MERGSAEKTELLAKLVGEELTFPVQESPFVVALKGDAMSSVKLNLELLVQIINLHSMPIDSMWF